MKKSHHMDHGSVVPASLFASAIIGLLALLGFYMVPTSVIDIESETDMYITPDAKTLSVGETFTIEVDVIAAVPVNVFTGTLMFDPEVLKVSSIDYNTSVADLWTEEPWYENGDGTIGFAGGTTRSGGFIGTDTLITVSFEAIAAGDGDLHINMARILKHNGLGTDAELAPLAATDFTVTDEIPDTEAVIEKNTDPVAITITKEAPTTDLNADGATTIADLSIFMGYLTTGRREADFNTDGKVNTADLSILFQSLSAF